MTRLPPEKIAEIKEIHRELDAAINMNSPVYILEEMSCGHMHRAALLAHIEATESDLIAAQERIGELERKLEAADKMVSEMYTQRELDERVQDAINEYRSDMR